MVVELMDGCQDHAKAVKVLSLCSVVELKQFVELVVHDDHDCCQLELAWWLSSLWMAVGLWMVAGNCAKAIMCNGIACDGWLLRSSKSVQQ